MKPRLFTPAEAAEATDLSVEMQRDWRKRDLMPPRRGGHSRFEVFELAEMRVLRKLSSRGIGPVTGDFVALEVSLGVVSHVLRMKEAYEPDLTPQLRESTRQALIIKELHNVRRPLQVSRKEVLEAARYCIWWADNTIEYASSLDAAVDLHQQTGSLGVTVIFDIAGEALDLVRATGPVVVGGGAAAPIREKAPAKKIPDHSERS